MKKIEDFLILLFGFFTFLFFILFKKQGTGKFYIATQNNKFLKKFLDNKNLNYLFENYNHQKKTLNSQFSSFSKAYKEDTNFTEDIYNKHYRKNESDNLENQQRGLIIPLIKKITENNKIKNLIEIGCGNGDLISYFSDLYADKNFTGIDFNTDIAKQNHKSKNLNFISDYALNYLIDNDVKNIDIIFSTSTFIFFTPNEIEKYLQTFNSRAKFIIISDPTWHGVHNKKFKKNSLHLETGVWFHNYQNLANKYNFEILENNFFNYKHKLSKRPDIVINQIILKKRI
tara:strand:- start:859 stop:1716 length:858 start_codon:yes stop_codon:yes gene_type:complete